MDDKVCSVAVCDRKVLARGLCGSHYSRWSSTGDPGTTAIRKRQVGEGDCTVDGCPRPRRTKELCFTHYARLREHGDPGPAEIRTYDPAPCSVGDCGRKTCGQGLCRMHYERKRKGRPMGDAAPQRAAAGEGSISNGYRSITVARGETKLEHRELMERLLGRPLLRTETVHHVNGQRADNRITDALDENFRSGNLELWSTWQPYGQRVSDKVAWAIELLEEYEPERLLKRRLKVA